MDTHISLFYKVSHLGGVFCPKPQRLAYKLVDNISEPLHLFPEFWSTNINSKRSLLTYPHFKPQTPFTFAAGTWRGRHK